MNKQEMIDALYRKVVNCRNEAKHYEQEAHAYPDQYAQFKELQGWYEGRASAFKNAIMMLEQA